MKHSDVEHLKQNVPIFILHRQMITLLFMRDSSFISPRDVPPAQRREKTEVTGTKYLFISHKGHASAPLVSPRPAAPWVGGSRLAPALLGA